MSDNLLQEYKEYYATRAEKYAGNPNYRFSYEAEKRLSDAMQSCSVLEEFRDKIGDLNEKCAIALVKDENIMEKAHFEKHKEFIRAKGPERILEKADQCKEVMDLVGMVTEELNRNSIEISMDESHRQLVYDWFLVDEIEIYENAVVPDKYKQSMMESAAQNRKSLQSGIERLEKNNHEWQAGWRINPDLVMEYRHKRLLPYKDEHILEQTAKYKSIINR
ncbi:MAG: hypothetical protein ABIJ16_09790 [Bacteroidota bacterium]